MQRGIRFGTVSAIIAAATLVIHADTPPSNQSAEIQLQLGRLFFDDGRYIDSLEAYQKALAVQDAARLREARSGVIQSALRIAQFEIARREADKLLKASSRDAETLSLYADALWASGLFEEADGGTLLVPWLPLHGQ